MAKKKPTIVSLDQDQLEWLEGKVREGYSKSGLIRYAVKRLMAEPSISKETREITINSEDTKEPNKPIETVEIESILEVLIKMEESKELDKKGIPNILDAAKSMQLQFKNIDHLYLRTAFELGMFKVEMETVFNQAMQKELSKTKS